MIAAELPVQVKRLTRLDKFSAKLRADFEKYDFPNRTIPPTKREKHDRTTGNRIQVTRRYRPIIAVVLPGTRATFFCKDIPAIEPNPNYNPAGAVRIRTTRLVA